MRLPLQPTVEEWVCQFGQISRPLVVGSLLWVPPPLPRCLSSIEVGQNDPLAWSSGAFSGGGPSASRGVSKELRGCTFNIYPLLDSTI